MKVRPPLLHVFLCVHSNDCWPDKHAHLRLVEGKKDGERKKERRRTDEFQRTECAEREKKEEKRIVSIRYDESDDERRILANVG